MLLTFVTVVSLLVSQVQSALSCGSLMTYRQYSVILKSAPVCFTDGCGVSATTMSSECDASQPCSHLWKFMREQWQPDWCSSGHHEIACRIHGWPVLNITATCATQPREWLFSNTGSCCVTDGEPFELADWIGSLCNGSEWRKPFEYFGGMAKEDWAEWIEPWNWTVKPENISHEPLESTSCSSPSTTLRSLAIENAATLAELPTEVFFFWLITLSGRGRRAFRRVFKMPSAQTFRGALISGIWYPIVHWLLSSFLVAAEWHAAPGYGHIPLGLTAFLLCARPNILLLLTCVLLIIDRLWDRFLPNNFNVRIPRTNLWIDNLARVRARQLLASLGFSISVTEFLIQALGIYSIGRATNTARERGIYHANNLTPYWHGTQVMYMYGGALVHTILAFITVLSLYLSAYLHTKEAEFYRRMFDMLSGVFDRVNTQIAQERQQRREQQMQERQPESTGQVFQIIEPERSPDTSMIQIQPHFALRRDFPRSRTRTKRPESGLSTQGAPLSTSPPASGEEEAPNEDEEEEEVQRHWSQLSVSMLIYIWLRRGMPDDILDRYRDLEIELEEQYGIRPPNHNPTYYLGWVILILTTVCATINFIAQWLFWAGFMKSQGSRYVTV